MGCYTPLPGETERVGKQLVDAAYCVHRTLGPGLLETVYEACLTHELHLRQETVERQVPCRIVYRGLDLDAALRLDLVVGRCVVVELKAVESLCAVHRAQMLSYLRLSGLRLGYLINFNVERIRDGIERVIL